MSRAFRWWEAGEKLTSLPSFLPPRVSFCARRVRFNSLPTIQTLEQAKLAHSVNAVLPKVFVKNI